MIGLLKIEDYTPEQYALCIILYGILHTTLFSILTTQYYTKILEHIVLSFNISSMYKNALIHTVVINLPRLYFVMKSDTYCSRSTITGFNALNLSLGLGLILLNTCSKSFIKFNSYLKDTCCLTISLISQAICLQENTYPVFLKDATIGVFLLFLFYTLRLRDNYRQENIPVSISGTNFVYLKKISKYFSKFFYDIVVLDIENFHKQSITSKIKTLCSPVINTGIFNWYFKFLENTQDILIALFLSSLIGLVLVKCAKNQSLQIINFFYGLISTMLYSVIFIDRVPSLVQRISSQSNINQNYMNMIFTASVIALPEILNLIYYSRLNKSSQAICSLLYSLVLNSLFFVPLRKLINSGYTDPKYEGDRVGLSIATISLIVSTFNYIMKNQKLSKDLGCVLVFIYVLYNLTFILDPSMFITKFSN
ncbi:hypothetical protein P3W45_000296 [Vairimorpha bombi]|jgi:Ca2+/Na+ antiporter